MSSMKIVAVLAACALFLCVEGRVIKTKEMELPKEGIDIMIAMVDNSKKGKEGGIATVDFKIRKVDNKIKITAIGDDFKTSQLPQIGTRYNVKVGTCPIGYTMKGGFCFPDDNE